MTENKKVGKIYRIYDNEDNDQFYIGSTFQKRLSSRLAVHRYCSGKDKFKNMKLYVYINNLPNRWNDVKIELVEETKEPISHDELLKLEGETIRRLTPPLNKNIAGNTKKEGGLKQYRKEYFEQNHDKLIQQMANYNDLHREDFRNYYKDHKEHIQARQKQYYKDHTDHFKAYREKNKDRIREYQREYKHKKRAEAKQALEAVEPVEA